jgi:hypothetical protein
MENAKGESDIFCMLGRIVLSNNKMVLYCGIPARQSQQYRTSGECKKENPISFACLDVSYFQTTNWYCTVEYRHVKANNIGRAENAKGESDIFCMLGRIVLSNNKMVLYCGMPACQSQQCRMIGECKKENLISFACLDVSYFQTTKWYCTVEYRHFETNNIG